MLAGDPTKCAHTRKGCERNVFELDYLATL